MNPGTSPAVLPSKPRAPRNISRHHANEFKRYGCLPTPVKHHQNAVCRPYSICLDYSTHSWHHTSRAHLKHIRHPRRASTRLDSAASGWSCRTELPNGNSFEGRRMLDGRAGICRDRQGDAEKEGRPPHDTVLVPLFVMVEARRWDRSVCDSYSSD